VPSDSEDLALTRVLSWLALLARSDAAKDMEIEPPWVEERLLI